MIVSMHWLMAGCVVPEPEKFREPKRTAPVINVSDVDPPINKFIPVDGPDQLAFSIPFRSEDVGERPVALLYLDYGTPEEQLLGSDAFQTPSTFDDPTTRTFNIFANFNSRCEDTSFERADVACCHQVRLLATHESSLTPSDAGVRKPDPKRSIGDLAVVVWWLAVAEVGKNPKFLGPCPTTGNP